MDNKDATQGEIVPSVDDVNIIRIISILSKYKILIVICFILSLLTVSILFIYDIYYSNRVNYIEIDALFSSKDKYINKYYSNILEDVLENYLSSESVYKIYIDNKIDKSISFENFRDNLLGQVIRNNTAEKLETDNEFKKIKYSLRYYVSDQYCNTTVIETMLLKIFHDMSNKASNECKFKHTLYDFQGKFSENYSKKMIFIAADNLRSIYESHIHYFSKLKNVYKESYNIENLNYKFTLLYNKFEYNFEKVFIPIFLNVMCTENTSMNYINSQLLIYQPRVEALKEKLKFFSSDTKKDSDIDIKKEENSSFSVFAVQKSQDKSRYQSKNYIELVDTLYEFNLTTLFYQKLSDYHCPSNSSTAENNNSIDELEKSISILHDMNEEILNIAKLIDVEIQKNSGFKYELSYPLKIKKNLFLGSRKTLILSFFFFTAVFSLLGLYIISKEFLTKINKENKK